MATTFFNNFLINIFPFHYVKNYNVLFLNYHFTHIASTSNIPIYNTMFFVHYPQGKLLHVHIKIVIIGKAC